MNPVEVKKTTDTNLMVEQARRTPAVFVNKFILEGMGEVVKLTYGEASLTPQEQERGVSVDDQFQARGAIALTVRDMQTLHAVLTSVLEEISANSGA